MDSFLNWARSKGITFDHVKVKESLNDTGYGLYCSQDAPLATPMIHIPSDLLITSSVALNVSPVFKGAIADYYTKHGHDLEASSEQRRVLTLFLVYCQFIDPHTIWSEYFAILPSIAFFQTHHVLFNPNVLESTSLWHAVRAKRHRLEQLHASLSGSEFSQVTLEMILWADAVLWSRVVEIESDRLALVPFFDFANHSQQPNLRWQLVDAGLVMATTEPVVQGQELMLSYGSKPNQELLFIHGFCIPNNPVESVVHLPWMPFFLQDTMAKVQWLRPRVPPTLELGQCDSEREGIQVAGWDWNSVMVMYLAALDSEDIVFSNDKLMLQGQAVTSLSELEAVVCQLDHFPVIQLRAVVLLMDALEYQLAQEMDCEDSPVVSQVAIYRAEERQLMQQSMRSLIQLQEQLMTEPTVQAFLQANA